MPNPYTQFRQLLPSERTSIVDITAHNGDGTSTATTLSGSTIVVQGDTVAVGAKAFVREGRVLGEAPSLPSFQETV